MENYGEWGKYVEGFQGFCTDFAWVDEIANDSSDTNKKNDYFSGFQKSKDEVSELQDKVNATVKKWGKENGFNLDGFDCRNSGSMNLLQEYYEQKVEADKEAEKKAGGNSDRDPIVVDLNKNGVYSTKKENGAHFDFAGDSFAEKTAWVEKGDGLLVRDIDKDGIIEDGTELFGDETRLRDGSIARDGFQALADLDENQDGVLDSQDAAFSEIQIWQDANGDGITDEGELYALSDMDITSIQLTMQEAATDENGNRVVGEGTLVTGSGDSYTMGELFFDTDSTNTIAKEKVEISEEIKNTMPELYPSGNILTLRQSLLWYGQL